MSARAVRRLLAAAAVAVAVVNVFVAAGSNFLSISARALARGDDSRLIDRTRLHELHRLGDARLLLLLAALALLASVPGLLRGRRAAWWTALAGALGSLVGNSVSQLRGIGLVLSVVLVAIVLANRARFSARANPARIAQGVSTIVVGLGLVFVYGAVGIYYLDANFRRSTTLLGSLYESARLVLLLPTAVLQPTTGHGYWFINSIRLLAVVVILGGLVRALAPVTIGPSIHAAARAHVERLLQQYGSTALAPLHLLDGKTWFFAGDGEAVLSYRQVGSVAVVLGAPVGAPGSTSRCVREFLTHCVDSGWTPVFHQVGDADRALLEDAGLRLLKIGEEAVVPLDEFTLQGSDMKSLRSTLKRVERVGCRFEVLDGPIDDATMDELREVSDSWMTASGHRERTFTVGRFDPEYLRATTVAVVRDADERIVAFVNILPSYHCPEGNFDLMRRRPDAVNGVMEFLFVSLIEHFRSLGLAGMNIGLAPLSGVEGDGLSARVLCAVREHAGAFNFEGLRAFKAKWTPNWESRYIAYEREVDLPRIAIAISRVGELEPEQPERRLVSVARRYPFSLAMIGLTLWFSIASDLQPHFERLLRNTLGLSYLALTRLEVWRLVTAPTVEGHAGFVWAAVALVVIVLPLAERRLGTLRTTAVFFIGSFLVSVSTFFVWAAMSGGHDVEAVRAFAHDAGPTAGCWALAMTLVFTIAPARRRQLVATVAFGALLVALAIMPHFSGVERLIAASVGALLGVWWARRPPQLAWRHATTSSPPSPVVPTSSAPALVDGGALRA